MQDSQALKRKAEIALKGRWRDPVLVGLFYGLVMGLGDRGEGRGLIQLILGGPATLGYIHYHLLFIREGSPRLEDALEGFRRFREAFILFLVRSLYIFLWSLLLIVPGVIAAFRYAMAFFILEDHPDMRAMDALEASKDLMEGNKSRLLDLLLSFFGWFLVGIFTLGIGFLWIGPYFRISLAYFYEAILLEREGVLPSDF